MKRAFVWLVVINLVFAAVMVLREGQSARDAVRLEQQLNAEKIKLLPRQ
jgi:hypothetical protein